MQRIITVLLLICAKACIGAKVEPKVFVHSASDAGPSDSVLGNFSSAAISIDGKPCAQIGVLVPHS